MTSIVLIYIFINFPDFNPKKKEGRKLVRFSRLLYNYYYKQFPPHNAVVAVATISIMDDSIRKKVLPID